MDGLVRAVGGDNAPYRCVERCCHAGGEVWTAYSQGECGDQYVGLHCGTDLVILTDNRVIRERFRWYAVMEVLKGTMVRRAVLIYILAYEQRY